MSSRHTPGTGAAYAALIAVRSRAMQLGETAERIREIDLAIDFLIHGQPIEERATDGPFWHTEEYRVSSCVACQVRA